MSERPSIDPTQLNVVTSGEPASIPDQPPQTVEANETNKERPEFSLDGWAYNRASLDRLTAILEEKSPGIRVRLEQALEQGGGKAFGLVICELLAAQYRAEGRTVAVPPWEIVPNYAEQQTRIEEEFSTQRYRKPDGLMQSKVILRSSAPDEDWLSEQSGVLQSYADLSDLKHIGSMPEVPFVLQELVPGYGAVIDVGHSELIQETVVHVAAGNKRGDDFTSAVSDPEASVALFNEQGQSIVPARAFKGVGKTFFKNDDRPHNQLLPDISTKLRNLGIDFGVQLEAVINEQDPNIVHIIQIRPTPERLRKSSVQNRDTSPELRDGRGEIVAQTAITSGVFDVTAQPNFHLEKQIAELRQHGETLAKTIQDIGMHESYARRVNIPVQEEKLSEWRAQVQALEAIIPQELRIGFFHGTGSDGARLDRFSVPGVNGGAYLLGMKGLIFPGQITPASQHGSLSVVNPQMTKYLVERCGMLSIPREQIAAIQERYASSPNAKLRVVSDGLVGQVILYHDEKPMSPMADSQIEEQTLEDLPAADVERDNSPYTPGDLVDLRKALQRERDRVFGRVAIEHPELTDTERVAMAKQERERLTQNLLNQLLIEKERFQSVFRTEQGSTYFVMKSGQAMRFKIDDEDGLQIQTMFNTIVYLSDEAKQAMQTLFLKGRLEQVAGVRIPLTPLTVGAKPFEFNGRYPESDTEYETGQDAEGEYLRIWGNRIPEERRHFYQGPGAVPPADRQPASVTLGQLVEYWQSSSDSQNPEVKQYLEKYGQHQFGGIVHFGNAVSEVIK